ncbi:unnamed protein product [Citrullus colocynthis]|uniref:Uncharacterized protein n=1 Tax=Citrullus colocynthis TaxID=252529 RepID=A0ABP0YG24_9ROSI
MVGTTLLAENDLDPEEDGLKDKRAVYSPSPLWCLLATWSKSSEVKSISKYQIPPPPPSQLSRHSLGHQNSRCRVDHSKRGRERESRISITVASYHFLHRFPNPSSDLIPAAGVGILLPDEHYCAWGRTTTIYVHWAVSTDGQFLSWAYRITWCIRRGCLFLSSFCQEVVFLSNFH